MKGLTTPGVVCIILAMDPRVRDDSAVLRPPETFSGPLGGALFLTLNNGWATSTLATKGGVLVRRFAKDVIPRLAKATGLVLRKQDTKTFPPNGWGATRECGYTIPFHKQLIPNS